MTQEKALQILLSGVNVFLTGEPGSGKTYTINRFTEALKESWIYPSITASTGIAATHINGTTIHSWAGLGIKEDLTDRDIETIIEKFYIRNRLENAKVLVIDEVSMLSAGVITNVDRVCRAARGQFKPFGGLQVIFVGDFFQLPPVMKGDADPVRFAFESPAWKEANPTVCYLTEQHRTQDPKFTAILTSLRNGTLTREHIKVLKDRESTPPDMNKVTRLFTHNIDVDRINEKKLAELKTEKRIFKMRWEGNQYLVETLKKGCLSPETLVLKIGALVMFTRNNFDEGYVNGTIGEVIGFNDNGNVLVKAKNGDVFSAGECEWQIQKREKGATIWQIPLRLAWAITVHKSQGMSLDAATVDLSGAFEYGQGYVALSRVRSLDGLYIEGLNAKALKVHPKIAEQDLIFRNS